MRISTFVFATFTACSAAGAALADEAAPTEDAAMVAAGRHVFNNCIACHSIEPGKRGFGPSLHGVIGRPAASLPDFAYSQALKTSKIVWTVPNLRKWIGNNDKMVPGTRMRHVAITDRAEQDYLIAFLRSLSQPVLVDQAKAAELLLARAVEAIGKDGPQAAFDAFNRRDGGFSESELYVFVFSLDGRYEASGANPKLVGQDARDMKDAEGKFLVREMIDIARNKGEGTVEYVWLNRIDNKVETKRSLIKRVGDHIVGVGYYLN